MLNVKEPPLLATGHWLDSSQNWFLGVIPHKRQHSSIPSKIILESESREIIYKPLIPLIEQPLLMWYRPQRRIWFHAMADSAELAYNKIRIVSMCIHNHCSSIQSALGCLFIHMPAALPVCSCMCNRPRIFFFSP
jgi:hypothetical protein